MGRMPRLVELGKKDRRLGEPSEVSSEETEALELDPRVELIRQLIPLGLAEVGRMFEEGTVNLIPARPDFADENAYEGLSRLQVSGRSHQSRRLAVPPVHPEFSRR